MSRRLLALALSGLLLTGCFTGKRPHFEDVTTTGDRAIDAVLAGLDSVTRAGGRGLRGALPSTATSPARPSSRSTGNRNVTIGNVRYLDTAAVVATCTVDLSQPCVDGLDPARISDTLLTIDFYASDTAKRLRRDAQAALGPATARTETIAGQTATCADVPLQGGTAVYCVLANGMLALLDDGDVRVTLTLTVDQIDPTQFVPPAGA
jgi:hypothetical protein